MNVPFSPPDITEEEIAEVAETLRSGWITTGPRTKEFERRIADYLHTHRAVCLNSATACLEMTLHLMGIGPGDEVITTAYTYTATCSCICHAGATPVLVDTMPGSYEMDPEQVRQAVTKRTKAIICVDLAGIVYSRYDEIFRIAEEKKRLFSPANERQKAMGRILVIADAAHAFGASQNGKMCGEIADFSCFSFHAVKNLTTAEGGAVTWSQAISQAGLDGEVLYRDYMLLSLHGQSKDALAKTQAGAWEYDIVAPYYKCNMTDIMAAIGLIQLKRYPDILKRRKNLIEQYDEALKDCPVKLLRHFGEDYSSSGHLYLVSTLDKSRQECNNIITKLAEAGIATNVHYKPLPMLSAYSRMGFDIKDYPNAYAQFEKEITLPLHTCLTDEQVKYVADTFRSLII
ncbi:DegT/DnrJ/EryC1/StrS family aminotransferase [Clostridium sp. C105KSO13]|uniref:DegT/DnrJ/EryC1/StrS family aminotransferase n=1 Tax=Clostridium sp. C105KSO13 TaxID=1776045 RepID=UPI00074062A5|nr:DegT/DnrJ/EryC1/StrS aminotransferase family protein [Clostridium sp. C105KSO13]CUX34263.1 UDP-4-amino-4-deoxy-L-arabinose--oxoglutarate aminotransferase [Clostridium sp. C105KSO13]